MKCRLPAFLILLLFAGQTAMDHHALKRTVAHPPAEVQSTDGPLEISVCKLKSAPQTYNHKLVEVTGFVSHGFEDFTLFDPACDQWPSVWLEYGGTAKSGTMYCCGVTAERTRPQPLVVEGITVELVQNDHFKQFDKLISRGPDSLVHATIVGRFFSGEVSTQVSAGYGHMGCCSLLAIQQIVAVDPHESTELDYGASADQPNLEKGGCGYDILNEPFKSVLIKAQERADLGEEAWAFSDPKRVASEELARLLKFRDPSTIELTQTSQRQGRFIYWWRPRGKRSQYMVIVSRPYLLSFYAKGPARVAWVVIGVYKTFCGSG